MKKSTSRLILYILSFFIALQTAIPAYINSSFIGQYLSSEKLVGLLYVLGSIFSIIGLLITPYLLKKIGNFKTITLATITCTIILFILAFSHNQNLILFSFILFLVLGPIIYFNLDIFLEQQSEDKNTGNIRGAYLSAINIAWLFSPLLAGLLLINESYWKIYLSSAIISLPIILLLIIGTKKFKDPLYHTPSFFKTLKKISKTKNIYKIFMIKFLLSFFYAWMVIYTPLYLHNYMNFSWQTIGIIFTIMLLPFVLLELPLGKLADKLYGEKEILNIGIIILAISTIMLSFLGNTTIWLWAGILFLTRVGASAIEISSESYFFKSINAQDANVISFFRITNPLAYSIAPLTAFIILSFLDFRYLFLVLGIIMLFGLRYGLTLKDTK